LAADTLWLEGQHVNLLKSMDHFLADNADARVLIIAGFHTGRPKVLAFFEIVPTIGFMVESIVEINALGGRRAWDPHREEDKTQVKRWVVAAVLKRLPGRET
jgi:nicotinamide N-methyltransferase